MDNAGQFILSINFAMLLAILSRRGFDNLALKVVAVYANGGMRERTSDFLYKRSLQTLWISIPILTLLWMAVLVARFLFPDSGFIQIWIFMAPAVVFITILGILSSSFQALDRAVLAIFFQAFGLNLAVIAASLLGATTAGLLALAHCGASIVLMIIGMCLLRRYLARLQEGGTKTELLHFDEVEMQNTAKAFWIVSIFQNLSIWGAYYVASAVLEPTHLSSLVLAQQASLVITLVLQAVILVYAPRFALMHRQGRIQDLEALGRRAVVWIALAVLPIAMVLTFYPIAVLSLFGDGLDEGATALRILTVGQFVNAITGPVGVILLMAGHERAVRNLLLAAVPASLCFAAILGMAFGILGFAVSTAGTLIVTNILATFILRRTLGIYIHPFSR
ncbi:MAG: polysaccharide biosynthesis C-terminal domain-containing protein [Paracoccaceae bacterium]